MELVKLSSKGQLVIPKAVRERLGIQPNKFVLIEIEKDRAVIRAATWGRCFTDPAGWSD